MADVVNLGGLKTQPNDILERAQEQDLEYIIVLGRKSNGDIYQDTSSTNGTDILALIEQGRFDLLHNLFG